MKYPYEIVSFVRKKTFSVDAKFSKFDAESDADKVKPLWVLDGTFSRFVFNIIAGGKAAYANVPISKLAGMKFKSNMAANIYYNPNAQKSTSPATTVKFAIGNNAGKTPAQVFLMPNGANILNEEYKFLKDNLDKYPRNQKLIDAILDVKNLKEEDLQVEGVQFDILENTMRSLQRKTRDDGLNFCYEVSVIFDSTRNYPVIVRVNNYYAPVTKDANQLLNIQKKDMDKSSLVSHEFSLAMDEWLHVLECMDEIKLVFKNTFFKEAYAASEKQREEYLKLSDAS